MASFISVIFTLIKVKRGETDEREELIIFKSLAYAMIILIIIHFVQLILGFNSADYFESINRNYIPIISGGFPFKSVISNDPFHIEAVVFDTFLFGIIYPLMRKKYGG
ncbi:hypothetical protein IGI67_001357 [Enterococcus sp. AZ196]